MAANYSSFERQMARVLSSMPWIKGILKSTYSRLSFLLNKKAYRYKSDYIINTIEVKNSESFFGYYDKAPDNGSGLILVYSSEGNTSSKPHTFSTIDLNVYCTNDDKFILSKPIKVRAFNWQQGSRAHWLSNDEIIFNNYNPDEDTYYSEIFSIEENKIIKRLDMPVQDSFDNKFILSICYKTLAKLRPDYGYFNVDYSKLPDINETGVWKTDISSGKTNLLISLGDIVKFSFTQPIANFTHKVNHIMISPDGSDFIFMHRYYNKQGKRFDRLLLSDCSGKIKKVLADNQMVSHCYWYDNNNIIGYLRSPDGVDGYWLINVNSMEYSSFNAFESIGAGDGHPSVNGDYIVTDTYPNKARMQSLYLSKKGTDKSINLGEFFHGFNFTGETRCDLHPRISSCSNFVFFDSVFSGKRMLCYVDVKNAKDRL